MDKKDVAFVGSISDGMDQNVLAVVLYYIFDHDILEPKKNIMKKMV